MTTKHERPVSHAEGSLDRLLWQSLFSTQQTPGVFVDVGAGRPDYLSNSALFRSLGWRVIAIEPNPAFCELYRQRGYEVLQYACGDHDQDNVPFSLVESHNVRYRGGHVTYESFSSLDIKDAYARLKSNLDIRGIEVKLRRLDTLLQTYAPEVSHIDILSVDVEGWEMEVLRGIDASFYRPTAMIIENLFDENDYRATAESLGYKMWTRIYPNDIYVPNDLLIPSPSSIRRAIMRVAEMFRR